MVSNVILETIPKSAAAPKPSLESLLETIDISTSERTVIHRTLDKIEAPNWSPDGSLLLFNSNGRMFTLPITGGTPQLLDTGTAVTCNNDHGISPDGALLAITDRTVEKSPRIYVVPIKGGPAREVTRLAPSYWHG